jgi:hypothetical protein
MTKPSLSWNKEDYEEKGQEAPACVSLGVTEGESFETEDTEEWLREQVQCLSVLKETYPARFEELYQEYLSDLDYLYKLGKITKEDKEAYQKSENFNFGQE